MLCPCAQNLGSRTTTKTTTSIKIAVRQKIGRQAACMCVSVDISHRTVHVHKYSCTSNRIHGPFLFYMNYRVVLGGRHIFGVDLYSGKCSIYTYTYISILYKRVVCVCLSVCLLFIGHTTFVHFAVLPPSGREQEQPSSRAAPRARASACTARARARMPYNFSTKKSLR